MTKRLLTCMAAGACMMLAANANAQNHDFAGSYLMNNMYMATDGGFSMDPLPLVINEDNMVTVFGNYDMAESISQIYGVVNEDTFTFKSNDDYLIVGVNWDNFHYIVLNGENDGDEYVPSDIVLSYDPLYDSYSISSWTLWEYAALDDGTMEKLGTCYVFSLEPGTLETVDYSGTYTATGLKTVYVDGVAQEPVEAQFTFNMELDSDGDYEFSTFGGYDVDLLSGGWYGVFGKAYGNVVEIQGVKINMDAQGNGLQLSTAFDEGFDDRYTVAIVFDDLESGSVSNFGVWRFEDNEPVEIVESWSYLTFTVAESSAIRNIDDNIDNIAAPVYFDLQGRKVENPGNGLYILKQGNQTKKVMIRK